MICAIEPAGIHVTEEWTRCKLDRRVMIPLRNYAELATWGAHLQKPGNSWLEQNGCGQTKGIKKHQEYWFQGGKVCISECANSRSWTCLKGPLAFCMEVKAPKGMNILWASLDVDFESSTCGICEEQLGRNYCIICIGSLMSFMV